MQQVIVEPDTIGPWIGVVGVVLGIVITTATDSLRSRRREGKERHRANQAAADELLAAANTLIVVRSMFEMAVSPQGYGGHGDSPYEWIVLWMRQSERIQKSSEELVRYGPPNLAVLGMKVARAANVIPVQAKEGFPEELESIMSEFATEMRTSLGSLEASNQPSNNRRWWRRARTDKRRPVIAAHDEDGTTRAPE